MIDRRKLMLSLGLVPAAALLLRGGVAGPSSALAAADGPCGKGTLTEAGLHMQPWFVQDSFLDMAEELAAAKEEGKHFVVVVEQKGCPYCKTMHEEYFTDAKVCNFIREHFRVLQIDLRGDREVTDFDGKTMPEKQWARAHLKLAFTPSLLFFEGDAAEIGKKPPRERAVAVMEGLYNPYDFRILFHYVQEGAWKNKSWRDYRREQWGKRS